MATSGDERFKCTVCGRISASGANLRVHMRMHTGEKPYVCTECGKSYSCSRSFRNHMGLHGEERPYKCSECPKSFVLSKGLRDHQRSHSDNKPFRCTYCGKAFRYKNVLNSHLIIHTGEGPYKCSECGMCYTAQSRLKEHMRSHTNERPYVCDVCGDRFTKNSALARHKVLHTGDRKYGCSICDKKFIVPSELTVHLQAHSGERHYCGFCGRSFKYKNRLQEHKRQSDSKGPQICSVCTKEFNRYCQLKEHMKTHKGRQIYNCTKCEKNFTLLTFLNEHMKSHSANRKGPRKCSVCFMVLEGNSQLKEHMKNHMAKEILNCSACNKIFMLSRHYIEHMKTHKIVKSQQSSLEAQLPMPEKIHINKSSLVDSEDVLAESNMKSIVSCADYAKEENSSHSEDICNSPTSSDEEDIVTAKRINTCRRKMPLGTRYKCTECGKISARFSDLTMSMTLDIEEIPYQCCDCDKRNIYINDVATPEENLSCDEPVEPKMSSEEKTAIENDTKKSYQCSWCDFNSTHNSQLRQHLKSHWQATESYRCNLCALTFHSETSLELHKKTHTHSEEQLEGISRIPQLHSIPPDGSKFGSSPPPLIPLDDASTGFPSNHNQGCI